MSFCTSTCNIWYRWEVAKFVLHVCLVFIYKIATFLLTAAHSGLVLAYLAAVWETAVSALIATAIVMRSLRHGLLHPSCSARSTQPAAVSGTVKWVSAFRLSNNNKCQRWMWMVAANYRWTHSPSWLAWSEGWRSVCIHQMNHVNSRNGSEPW